MLTIKNGVECFLARSRERKVLGLGNVPRFVCLLVLLAGCTPSGPRALIEGKRLVEQGKYPQAIEKLQAATALLGGTNAQAWNDLGLAYHHAGQAAEAEKAYQRALALDHDLSEARFNLGCLWLAQNRLEAAKGELMAYTLRRPNAAVGFLKLGAVQLRTREPSAAERSFNEALRLSPQNPEALNGLGLARLALGQPSEAAQHFGEALKQQPDYPPALLNLAIVAHQHLRDRSLALQKYREYVASRPPPANAEALAATVRQLEQELNPPSRHTATNAVAQMKLAATPPKPPPTNMTRTASAPRLQAATGAPKPTAARPSKTMATNGPKPAPTTPAALATNVEVVKLPPEPVLKRGQEVASMSPPAQPSSVKPLNSTSSAAATVAEPKAAKRGFFERINPLNLFRSGEKTPIRPTPLGPAPTATAREPVKTATAGIEPTAASHASPRPNGPPARYAYKSPDRPARGNRPEAERLFTKGVQAQQAHRLQEAIQAYRSAVKLDPSLFEAHYNLGLAATEAGNLPLALTAYENALAVQPASLDARYNFALVLKQGNHISEAVSELENITAGFPNEPRAHLALGNLYAQKLAQPAKARQHYLKVLEVAPRHPQAGEIRFWLAANPL